MFRNIGRIVHLQHMCVGAIIFQVDVTNVLLAIYIFGNYESVDWSIAETMIYQFVSRMLIYQPTNQIQPPK